MSVLNFMNIKVRKEAFYVITVRPHVDMSEENRAAAG